MTKPRPKPAPEDMVPCERCGEVHLTRYGGLACPGHIASGPKKGAACTHELGFGTSHYGVGQCRYHGGLTQNARKNALKVQLEDEARKLLGLTEWDPVYDPFTELANQVGKERALEEILLAKVEELASLKQFGGEMGDRIDVTVEAWERARERLVRGLQGMARLDLDARIAKLQAAIDKETALIVQRALDKALKATELSPAQRTTILQTFGKHLRVAPEPPALPA